MEQPGQYQPYLSWLESQQNAMRDMVRTWAEINSWSRNVDGLARMVDAVETQFEGLRGTSERLNLSVQNLLETHERVDSRELGHALRIRKRPDAPVQVFLCCHMDTVYPPDHPFQGVSLVDDNTLRGPGVADAKGGLVVMLKALEALELSPWAENVGWEVLVNPDEEIGSPGSGMLLKEAATRHHIGLVFEPCFPDGSIVGPRKGSGNFTVMARGRAAHAGREPHLGRNAVSGVAWLVVLLNAFAASQKGITVNVGYIEGGGPVNVVPDKAECRFNVRVNSRENLLLMEDYFTRVMATVSLVEGISLEKHGFFQRQPKPLDSSWQWLLEAVVECGRALGLDLRWRESGGACDGNNLNAEGLPTVDSLGVRGGDLHSPSEYVLLHSLAERAKLAALFLMKLASGEIVVPPARTS